MDNYLTEHPIRNAEDALSLRAWQEQQRQTNPLIKDNSVDLVVSNCVLNLVHDNDKEQLIKEIFRVTNPGGRVAISDTISDEPVPEHLKQDTTLCSGCISYSLQEHEFLKTFQDAGFVALSYDKWENQPWQVVEGLEFRSVTITAIKPQHEASLDIGHAVIYRGPYAEVSDDEGYIYPRGQRIAVSNRSFSLLTSETYKDDFIGISPTEEKPASAWSSAPGTLRPVVETKNAQHQDKTNQESCCC